MRLFVKKLPFTVSSDCLREVFEVYGEVAIATVPVHLDGGRSKGYGFVEMPIESEAQAAIDALNGAEWGGLTLTVEESISRNRRPAMPVEVVTHAR